MTALHCTPVSITSLNFKARLAAEFEMQFGRNNMSSHQNVLTPGGQFLLAEQHPLFVFAKLLRDTH
jgi:hypothetical protein